MKPQSHETRIQHQFDALSKAVLKYGARDYHRRLKNRRAHEVTFSELSEQDLAKLSVTDEYFKDAFSFSVLGHDVSVTDEQLAEALQTLSEDRRDIILLAFFLGMNDREIAEQLNFVRRTVADRRAKALQEIKKIMEGNADE